MPSEVLRAPRVRTTMTLANSLQPCVNTPKVELYAVVARRLELVLVEVFDHATLPSRPNGLLPGFSAREYLDMDHVMFLSPQFGIIIGATVKDKVSRFQVFKLDLNG